MDGTFTIYPTNVSVHTSHYVMYINLHGEVHGNLSAIANLYVHVMQIYKQLSSSSSSFSTTSNE